MSIIISNDVLMATRSKSLEAARKLSKSLGSDREHKVDVAQLSNADLQELEQVAQQNDEGKTARAVQSLLKAREGRFEHPVPSFAAFEGMLRMFLMKDLTDGWVYQRHADGKLYPYLVTSITLDEGNAPYGRRGAKAEPKVYLRCAAFALVDEGRRGQSMDVHTHTFTFEPQNVVRKRIADALLAQDLLRETPELKQEYLASLERFHAQVLPAFSKQFRLNGSPYRWEHDDWQRRGQHLESRKVVHDLQGCEMGALSNHVDSELFDKGDGLGAVPEHALVRVFDLKSHESLWVHGDLLTPYEYDLSLRDKLVLPETHRDLLDVLTSDLDAFVGDIIEGKSAGNIVLCRGIPGVGKTLTAEVYAELIGAPLYAIHSGTLGTNAESIESALKDVFARCKRWKDVVLLLDEADVFVLQRGDNLEQNAIVAEFLRVLEYFDGLMFMTSNRSEDIDDAIISRCAAIVNYEPPSPEHAALIWRVMAKQFESPLSDELIEQLLKLFPRIAPRDIKMLFRLALRVSRKHAEPLTVDVFRRCAMFRAIKMTDSAAAN